MTRHELRNEVTDLLNRTPDYDGVMYMREYYGQKEIMIWDEYDTVYVPYVDLSDDFISTFHKIAIVDRAGYYLAIWL